METPPFLYCWAIIQRHVQPPNFYLQHTLWETLPLFYTYFGYPHFGFLYDPKRPFFYGQTSFEYCYLGSLLFFLQPLLFLHFFCILVTLSDLPVAILRALFLDIVF